MNLRHILPASPHDMADARAVLTDPARHRAHPAVIQSHWQFLKEARGQRVNFDRMGPPAHRMSITMPPPFVPVHLRPPVPDPGPGLIARLSARMRGDTPPDAA